MHVSSQTSVFRIEPCLVLITFLVLTFKPVILVVHALLFFSAICPFKRILLLQNEQIFFAAKDYGRLQYKRYSHLYNSMYGITVLWGILISLIKSCVDDSNLPHLVGVKILTFFYSRCIIYSFSTDDMSGFFL